MSTTSYTPARSSPAASARSRVLQILGILAVLGTLVWFTVPVFGGHYNEGFQTVTVMNAEAILSGGMHSVDMLYPLVNDFFLASRFGVSVVLAGLLKLGLGPVTGFRLVMFVSLVLLVAANAAILVRHYRVNPVFACLPALLFPGVFESAWFFNDNVLSAALTSAALALFWWRRTLPATAVCGLLWGMAIACRTDAVLIAPAFLVLMWFELPTWRARLLHAAVAAPVVAAVPFLVFAAFGLHFLDILPLTHRAQIAWARNDPLSHVIHPFLKGFAPPGALAMAFGAISIIARRQWREILLCLAVPLIYCAAYGLMLTEVRYLLPLTPFFGILMVEGARAVFTASRRREWGLAAFAAAFLVCFAPPLLIPVHALWFLSTDDDMPRPSFGRFWSPVLGMWWNRQLEEGYDAIAKDLEAAAAPGGAGVVVSVRWTPDHTVDIILREHGFAGVRATTPASCHEIGEVFTRGEDRILHLRDHIPLIPFERSGVTWPALGLPCLNDLGKKPADPVLVVGQQPLTEPNPGLEAPGVITDYVSVLDISRWARTIASKSDTYFVATSPIQELPALLKPIQPLDKPGSAQWTVAHRDLVQ